MPKTIRVLILENDELWQDLHQETLYLGNGLCEAATFENVPDAMQAMHKESFQVAIVDLHLNKSGSSEDFGGYDLVDKIVEYGWLRNMVVCVVSHWSDIAKLKAFSRHSAIDIDKARRTIGSGVEVDNILYFSKNEYDHKQLWKRIQSELIRKGIYTEKLPQQRDILEILAHRMTRNMIEHIESSSEHSKLAPEDEWLREFYNYHGETALQLRLRMEISDLLMRWAQEVEAEDLHLSQIGSGLSKATVVKAMRQVNNIWELPVIIKMGYHREIQSEREAYKKLVRRFVLRVPPAETGSSTFLLAAQIYDYVHEGISFEEAYIQQQYPIETLEALVEDLAKNCSLWYQAKYQQRASAREYKEYLHCYLSRFQKPIEHLQASTEAEGQLFWDKEHICFPNIDGEFLNPLLLLSPQSSLSHKAFPAMRSFTHGDFNANNILIRQGQSWLIDFGRTEDSHAMRDFIQLEAVVKFVLLRGATLRERHELEQALLQQNHFEEIEELRQSYKPANPRVERAFRLVCKIREQVWTTVLHKDTSLLPVSDFEQYRMGLFFLTLNSVRFIRTKLIPDGIEPLHALHALMSAAMLGERLQP